MIKKMDVEFINIFQGKNMMVNGKMESVAVRVNTFTSMATNMTACGSKELNLEEEC